MNDEHKMKVIARLRSDLTEKFGIPRQSGLVESLCTTIVFEPQYRNIDAIRGMEGFSHLWLIWQFSEAVRDDWQPTVRPPRLGGNTRMGVFATRSPYRPNPIGLSSVKLLGIENTSEYGMVLRVSGADLMDGTPIYDIKPYLAFTDSHPEAVGGFADSLKDYSINVVIPEDMQNVIPESKREALLEILKNDPRPAYQNDPERIYKMSYAGFTVCFKVNKDTLCVTDIYKHI